VQYLTKIISSKRTDIHRKKGEEEQRYKKDTTTN